MIRLRSPSDMRWAPILLTVFRLLQPIGVGGELGGAVLLAVEHAPRRKRIFYGSLAQAGASGALVIATGVFALLALVGGDAMTEWAWRIPFLLAAPLIVAGLVLVRSVEETPEFTRAQHHQDTTRMPLWEVLTQHWRPMLLGVGGVLVTIGAFNLSSTFMIYYSVDQGLFTESQMLNATTFTGVVAVVATVAGGFLGDRFGARVTTIWAALACAVASFPMFWLTDTGVVGWMWVGLSLVMATNCIAYGCLPALLANWFPARVGNTGISLAYQLSGVLGYGVAPVAAAVLYGAGHPPYVLVAVFLAGMAVISTLCIVAYRGHNHLDGTRHMAAERPATEPI